MRVLWVRGEVMIEDVGPVFFQIDTSGTYGEGGITRWGQPTPVLGATVDLTEAVAEAVRRHYRLDESCD